jgi:two-component system chemotaxis response regulator CheB
VALLGLAADSAAALSEFLERDPGIEVVGVFATAGQLHGRLRGAQPDLLAVDLGSAGSDGQLAIERIMRESPVPILVLQDDVPGAADRAAEALAAGALEAVSKTQLRLERPDDVWATALRARVKRLASVRLKGGARTPAAPTAARTRVGLGQSFRIVAIGASTGGPPALTTVFMELPPDYPLPVLVVQHIAPGFTEGLVGWLDDRVGPSVRFAPDGERIGPGIWFAPDDTHLTVDSELRFALDRTSEHGRHRPSLDPLLESVAATVGPEALGVVLTGMGRDGAAGVEAIRAAGGLAIAQDDESSAVFGMPAAAIEAGADHVLPLAAIGPALASLRVREAA